MKTSIVKKSNITNPLDIETGGTNFDVIESKNVNSLGWLKSNWNWESNNIDTVNAVPHTNVSIRNFCLENVKVKNASAYSNDFGQLLSKDIFNNLKGMYYQYDDNGESFIYITDNASENLLSYYLFFRKSDFTQLIPSTDNKFKITGDNSDWLSFDVNQGVVMNIEGNSNLDTLKPVIVSSLPVLQNDSEVYLSYINKITSDDNIIIKDQAFTGVSTDFIKKIKPAWF